LAKHTKILDFALSSLLRRKYKNLGLIAVFSFVVFLLSSILFLTYSLRMESTRILEGAPELIVQKMVGGRHDLIPVKYAEEIERIPGVGRILPRYWGYYFDVLTGATYTILGADEVVAGKITMLEGAFSKQGQTGVCVIGKGVADIRLIGLDRTLPLVDAKGRVQLFKVVGVFEDASRMLTNDLIVLSPLDTRRLFDMPDGVATDLVARVYNPSELSNVASKIKRILPDTRPITKDEILRTYDTLFSWRSGLVLTVFLGAVTAFFILAWDKATGLTAEEKKEIGILKAIGWETSDILELKFWEGAAVSIISFLVGVIGSYIHLFFLGGSLFTPALKGWSVLFPEFHPVPNIDLYQIFILLFLTVMPYIVATIIPSWTAAITDPDLAMRG